MTGWPAIWSWSRNDDLAHFVNAEFDFVPQCVVSIDFQGRIDTFVLTPGPTDATAIDQIGHAAIGMASAL